MSNAKLHKFFLFQFNLNVNFLFLKYFYFIICSLVNLVLQLWSYVTKLFYLICYFISIHFKKGKCTLVVCCFLFVHTKNTQYNRKSVVYLA